MCKHSDIMSSDKYSCCNRGARIDSMRPTKLLELPIFIVIRARFMLTVINTCSIKVEFAHERKKWISGQKLSHFCEWWVLQSVLEPENELFYLWLPTRLAAMGIRDLVKKATGAFMLSRKCSSRIVDQIQSVIKVIWLWYKWSNWKSPISWKNLQWLNLVPLAKHHFNLSRVAFWDALALCCHRPPQRMPARCDRCGKSMSNYEAETYMNNVVRNALEDVAAMIYEDVLREPTVRVVDLDGKVPALNADLGIFARYDNHRLRHCSTYWYRLKRRRSI